MPLEVVASIINLLLVPIGLSQVPFYLSHARKADLETLWSL